MLGNFFSIKVAKGNGEIFGEILHSSLGRKFSDFSSVYGCVVLKIVFCIISEISFEPTPQKRVREVRERLTVGHAIEQVTQWGETCRLKLKFIGLY